MLIYYSEFHISFFPEMAPMWSYFELTRWINVAFVQSWTNTKMKEKNLFKTQRDIGQLKSESYLFQ